MVTREEIKASVQELLIQKKSDLEKKRYQVAGQFQGLLRKLQPWANALQLKEELDAQLALVLGPKDERDDQKAVVSYLNTNQNLEKEGKGC